MTEIYYWLIKIRKKKYLEKRGSPNQAKIRASHFHNDLENSPKNKMNNQTVQDMAKKDHTVEEYLKYVYIKACL